jgi:hypothetical protein
VGDLADELEEYDYVFFIKENVIGGQKNYPFSVFCPSTGKLATKSKVKRIILNYENLKVVNFATLRDMIHVHIPRKIKRKHCGVLVSEPEIMEYKVVFKKLRLMDDIDSNTFVY